MNTLTEIQKDAIAEILNIGMGSAAASLSEMVKEEVLLSLPEVDFIQHAMAYQEIQQIAGEKITAIKEKFNGSFWGDALLFFPEEQSSTLVAALFKSENIPAEMLAEMECEALTEIGNIILNACLGSLADVFGETFEYQLPEYLQGNCQDVLHKKSDNSDKDGVLLLKMEFSLQQTKVTGFLTLMMDVDSMQAFTSVIKNNFGDG